jgi:hypothetical protein
MEEVESIIEKYTSRAGLSRKLVMSNTSTILHKESRTLYIKNTPHTHKNR